MSVYHRIFSEETFPTLISSKAIFNGTLLKNQEFPNKNQTHKQTKVLTRGEMIQQILAALESKDKEQRKKESGREYKGILINNN